MAISSRRKVGSWRDFKLPLILLCVTALIFLLASFKTPITTHLAPGSNSISTKQWRTSKNRSQATEFMNLASPNAQKPRREGVHARPKSTKSSKAKAPAAENLHSRQKNRKKILIWNKYWKSEKLWQRIFHDIINNKCPHSACTITLKKSELNTSDAVLFHLIDLHLEKYRVPKYRNPKQIWIAMSFEPPYVMAYHGLKFQRINGLLFNRTMTYRQDADIVVRHGNICPLQSGQFTPSPPSYSSLWVSSTDDITKRNYAAGKQRLVAWFASSTGCKSQSKRELYVRQLQQYIPVDVYGSCGPYKCGAQKNLRNAYHLEEDGCYLFLSAVYKFVLAFENSICEDYVTEKLYNHLKLNVVPVVFGGANYSQYAPPHSVIDATQFTPKELADYLQLLDGNDQLYNEYFKWKKDYYVEAHDGVPLICDLCDKLSQKNWETEVKVYDRLDKWFYKGCHPAYGGNESFSYAACVVENRTRQ